MKPIAIKDLSENFFEVIGKEWMLVTAGNKDHFNTISFLGEENRAIHKICGSKSGREVDKVKETGLKPVITEKGNILFEQGRLSLECRKLYTDVMKEDCFIDPSVCKQWYGGAHGGLHHIYVAEITGAWMRE